MEALRPGFLGPCLFGGIFPLYLFSLDTFTITIPYIQHPTLNETRLTPDQTKPPTPNVYGQRARDTIPRTERAETPAYSETPFISRRMVQDAGSEVGGHALHQGTE